MKNVGEFLCHKDLDKRQRSNDGEVDIVKRSRQIFSTEGSKKGKGKGGLKFKLTGNKFTKVNTLQKISVKEDWQNFQAGDKTNF